MRTADERDAETKNGQDIWLARRAPDTTPVGEPTEVDALQARVREQQTTIERLRRYLPPAIAERVEHDPERLRAEWREVAVLFADAVDFTRLSTSLDVESVFTMVNELLARLVACVHRYAGLVDKFTGDGLMAVFGALQAHEASAEMAVRAALEMQEVTAALSPTVQAQLGAPLAIRVGIHFGPVAAGVIGTEEQAAYTVIGETVNLAARIQAQAQPGAILVSEAIFERTQAAIAYAAPERIAVRGVDAPIAVFEALDPLTPGGGELRLPWRGARFLGRQREIARVEGVLRDFRAAPQCSVLAIVGEAGMGKSRLVTEAIAKAGNGWRVVRGQAASYGQHLEHEALRSLAQDALGQASEKPFGENDRLRQWGSGSLCQAESHPGWTTEQHAVDIDGLLADIFCEWLRDQTAHGPIVVVLDDYQWADDPSRQVIQALITRSEALPLLFCILGRARGDVEAELALVPPARSYQIDVMPLTMEESRQLLEQFVDLGSIPETLVQTILSRSDGNPYYIEEFVRALIETRIVAYQEGRWRASVPPTLAEIDIPTSLRALMQARVDRLPPNQRAVLQDAAVIGMQFDRRLLELIEQRARGLETVQPVLERLLASELLVEVPDAGAEVVAFRHRLTRETIYESILRSQRPALHQMVAGCIEQLYSDDLDEQTEILAFHYDQARVHEKAMIYALQAGERAQRRLAYREAIEHYSRALRHSQHVRESMAQRWQAAIGLAEVEHRVGDDEEATALYQAALEEDLGQSAAARAAVMLKLSQVWSERGDRREAARILRMALAELEEASDVPLELVKRIQVGLAQVKRPRTPTRHQQTS